MPFRIRTTVLVTFMSGGSGRAISTASQRNGSCATIDAMTESIHKPGPDRFLAEEKVLWSFADRVDVQCPKCSQAAVVTRREATGNARLRKPGVLAYVVTCTHCGHSHGVANDVFPRHILSDGDPPEWLGCKLRRFTSCRGRLLWILNLEHCQYLRAYIAASLREPVLVRPGFVARLEKQVKVPNGYFVTSRLPGWMVTKSARPDVLKGLDHLAAL